MGRFRYFRFSVHDRRVQFAIIRQSTKIVPYSALGSAFNALMALIVVAKSARFAGAVVLSAIMVLQLLRTIHCRHLSRRGDEVLVPAQVEATFVVFALVGGCLWGAVLAIVGVDADRMLLAWVCMLGGGVLGAAVVGYGLIPSAGVAFMFPIACSGVIVWSAHLTYVSIISVLMIFSLVVLLARTMVFNENVFAEKIMGEVRLRETVETVQLLLNDFEERASDWLWCVDRAGRIEMPSARFVETSAQSAEDLLSSRMIDLFVPSPERDRLDEHLRVRHGFRDLTLQLLINGNVHWWTLSACAREGGMRGVASDVTAQRNAEARARHMVNHDHLTNIPNRYFFADVLSTMLRQLEPNQQLAILYFDLDDFKVVNEIYGYPVGDRLLESVARRIEALVGEGDFVARLGGDEFAVLATADNSAVKVEASARRIVEAVGEVFALTEYRIHISVSTGIAMSVPGNVKADDMMRNAHIALKSAKASGKGRIEWFEPEMAEVARERRTLEVEMRSALERNEFKLFYQPIVDIVTRRVVSYEALMRWNHPTRGLLLPSTFIGIAEETGFIVTLGEWAIREAVRTVATWPIGIGVSVNLSSAQVASPTLIPTIIDAITASLIDPGRLELEITETVLLDDSDFNVTVLSKIGDLGVRIALDDFGTGYSSLNYLLRFSFDNVKIDRSFVGDILDRRDCRAIVQSVSAIAEKLGMECTAEGVEEEAQLQLLRLKGCTRAQGYLFARPRPANQLTWQSDGMGAGFIGPVMPN